MLANKHSVSVAIFFMCGSAQCSPPRVESFMPPNNLWMEDSLEAGSNVSESQFNRIIDIATAAYEPIARANRETIYVQRLWKDSTVNANMQRDNIYRRVHINMFGGLARRPEVTSDGFALVLCHELGHAYGGKPFLNPSLSLSAEGIADYYAASACFNKIVDAMPSNTGVNNDGDNEYIAAKCNSLWGKAGSRYQNCVRALKAGRSLGRLLSVQTQEKEPNYYTPDKTVVKTTEISYPKTIQCRLDTYHNAVLSLVKPACWFKSEQRN